jgi:ribose transport system substrate-binding protein
MNARLRPTHGLLRHPDLKGIWSPWDGPAEGILAAAQALARSDIVVTTCDLGQNVAVSLARGGLVKGIAAQRVFNMGVAEARAAAYGLLGKPAPAYVTIPNMAVTRDNVLESWTKVYNEPAPDWLKTARG